MSSSDEMLCMLDVSIVLSSIRHSGMSSEQLRTDPCSDPCESVHVFVASTQALLGRLACGCPLVQPPSSAGYYFTRNREGKLSKEKGESAEERKIWGVRRSRGEGDLCEKQGPYDRPDCPQRRFSGHWPDAGAEVLAVAEAEPPPERRSFFKYLLYNLKLYIN